MVSEPAVSRGSEGEEVMVQFKQVAKWGSENQNSEDEIVAKFKSMLDEYEAVALVGANPPRDDGQVDSGTLLIRLKETEFTYDDGLMYTLMSLFMAATDQLGPVVMMQMLVRMAAELKDEMNQTQITH